ncbi:glutamyl aminopeptidase-like isoform X1 [Spodoptera litura]|uniref:Aminopeptidase n=1 Tax=Spodoptera litura TaxID=69820 RepID=A0A9J7DR08_SPOLT|nr:glutamyl aminopeptidase-like isoform X1 [Spodoptera litura]XP_022814657.1 glutamyl aminopeptidase-like isoform X1 [Spodoptera litura]
MGNPKIMEWTRNHKLLIFFMIVALCFFVSTVALATMDKNKPLLEHKPADNTSKHTGQNETNENKDDHKYYRLPRSVVPENYKLLLKPNVTNNSFAGSVLITLSVKQKVKTIQLHAYNLTIHGISLTNNISQGIIRIRSTNMSLDARELLFINLENELDIAQYKLFIIFSGRLDNKIVGFYKSHLKGGGTMVASKFQPTYARQAFPCFDEPDFKATYDITLWKPPTYTALSNMNEISTTYNELVQMDKVTFATSVPMSTYLVCFVVCDFDYKETDISSGGIGKNFKLRSYAQKQNLHKIDFAQDIGKRATEFYINYYEVPFPLPKLDMIAIPDYVSGATEHWGLITYRQTSFLVDQATSSSANKINVANTIAHELAHMWFGNLVTMKWWDEVWLNEGFASYMQAKALDAIEPSWKVLDNFLTKVLHPVLGIDAKLSSHPIVQTVATPDQITSIFDTISYNKGASILRMLEGFIGQENFRHGVSDYLKKYEFGNTVTQELLSSLEPYFKRDFPDLNLTYIMDTWTLQMGYPVLQVKRGDEANTFAVSQSRFLIDPDAVYPNDSKFNYKWFVPITYKTDTATKNEITWLADTAQDVKLKINPVDKWLKVNINHVGYYRVNYDEANWQALIEALKSKSKQLSGADRSHLLDDVFALAEARAVSYNIALDLTTYLLVEEELTPWQTAQHVFADIEGHLQYSLVHDHLMKYVQRIIRPIYAKQNWDAVNLPVIDSLLRTRILSLAVHYQVPEAVEKAKSMFYRWLNTYGTPEEAPIHQDLREMIYYNGMKSASMADWDKLWAIYKKEEDVQELLKIRKALSAPRDTAILRKFLLMAWDEANIRSQDYLTVVVNISSNPSGTALVWDDVRANWPRLVRRFTLNSRYLGGIIPSITSSFNTDLKLKEMESFFGLYPEAGAGETGRRQALESVKNNIRWSTYHLKQVTAWIDANYQS